MVEGAPRIPDRYRVERPGGARGRYSLRKTSKARSNGASFANISSLERPLTSSGTRGFRPLSSPALTSGVACFTLPDRTAVYKRQRSESDRAEGGGATG